MYQIRLSIACMLTLMGSIHTMNTEKPNPWIETLKNASIGGIAGSLEISVSHPMDYFKNRIQLNLARERQNLPPMPIEWRNPRAWYRGFGVNVAAMAPTTALQTGINAQLESIIPGNAESDAIARAFVAGLISASANVPPNMIIIHQQNDQQPAFKTLRKLINEGGYRALARGWTPTALREGIWSVGYLVMFHQMFQAIKNQCADETTGNIAGCLGAGAITGASVALVTQPLDTIRSCMQNDIQAKSAKTMAQAMQLIYKEKKLRGFFTGAIPRVASCAIAMPILAMVTQYLTHKAKAE